MTEPVDLLIVGGGPAGLATAIEARLAGFDATVIDRRRPPVDMACGEGLMPAGVTHLARLGATIPPEESYEFDGVRYLDGKIVAEAGFKSGAGLGIRRTSLHRAMVRRADELGVDLRWGSTARSIDGTEIRTDQGRLSGRWLVAADGRLSRLRRLAGIETTPAARPRFGVRRHYETAPWSSKVEVYWADEGEAYVTPVAADTVGVAVLSSAKPLDFDRHLGLFPELAERLSGAPRASRDRGAGPFGQRPATVVRDRLALVGDASGSLDPITGEGLALAFGQARAVIRAVGEGSLEGYSVAHSRLARTPRLLTSLLLTAERRPWLRRLTIRALAAAPRLFSAVVDQVGKGGRDLGAPPEPPAVAPAGLAG